MATKPDVYIEAGAKRAFAVALDWPGWCRRGRDPDEAIEALLASGARYRKSVGAAARGLAVPDDPSGLHVVQRVKGDATTDFGAPSKEVTTDARPLEDAELRHHQKLLKACWKAFDRAAEAGVGVELRKGPRGGGRDLEKIVEHVYEADGGYLKGLGGRPPKREDRDPADAMADLRDVILRNLRSRAKGEPPERDMRSTPWSPRFFVRRTAWHAIDHAWEIEDRSS